MHSVHMSGTTHWLKSLSVHWDICEDGDIIWHFLSTYFAEANNGPEPSLHSTAQYSEYRHWLSNSHATIVVEYSVDVDDVVDIVGVYVEQGGIVIHWSLIHRGSEQCGL